MARDEKDGRAGGPRLVKGDEGGPLSRRLMSIRLVRLVDFIGRASTLRYTRASGLSDFEWRVLVRVCETPELSLNDLAGLLHRNVAQASRAVTRLVGAGLVTRRNRGGGPGVLISPTPLGRSVYEPMVAMAVEADARLTAGLSEEDLLALERMLGVLTQNALALLGHEQAHEAENGR